MRADRLLATLLLLQARGRVTAAEVASELEVSVATARRDFEALSAAGIPIYPQPGRGGGWSLLGGGRTDLTGLTSVEAQSLFLLLGPAAGGDPDARSALRKLTRALPETFRRDAESAAEATIVDRSGWGSSDRTNHHLVAALQGAVVRRLRVVIAYRSWAATAVEPRAAEERAVDPWGLAEKDGTWYLLAGTDEGQRTFRVDRITTMTVTDERASRPVDFELTRAWDEVVKQIEGRRSRAKATVLVELEHAGVLRSLFGDHCAELAPQRGDPADVRRFEVAAQTATMIARQLAGWSDVLDVLEPVEVMTELARLGVGLTRNYAVVESPGPFEPGSAPTG